MKCECCWCLHIFVFVMLASSSLLFSKLLLLLWLLLPLFHHLVHCIFVILKKKYTSDSKMRLGCTRMRLEIEINGEKEWKKERKCEKECVYLNERRTNERTNEQIVNEIMNVTAKWVNVYIKMFMLHCIQSSVRFLYLNQQIGRTIKLNTMRK